MYATQARYKSWVAPGYINSDINLKKNILFIIKLNFDFLIFNLILINLNIRIKYLHMQLITLIFYNPIKMKI